MWAGLALRRSPRARLSLASVRLLSSVQLGKQGGTLTIDALALPKAALTIEARWNEHAEVSGEELASYPCTIERDEARNHVTLRFNVPDGPQQGRRALPLITVPEMFSVSVAGNDLDVAIKKKVMGDVKVETTAGSISLEKIKGTNITVDARQSDVVVGKVLEGGQRIRCKSLHAKMLSGEKIDIEVAEGVHVDAMYGSSTRLSARDDVRIGLFKGALDMKVREGNAILNGVDGTFNMDIKGNVELQVNKLHARESSADDEKQTNYDSSVRAASVECLLDPEIKADLECATMLQTEDNIEIDSDSFVLETVSDEMNSVVGSFTGVSNAVKRPRFQGSSLSDSGKIDLKTAESMKKSAPITSSLKLQTSGQIKVKTMSWIEVIQKRHGLLDRKNSD